MRGFFLLGCIGIATTSCALEASSIDERGSDAARGADPQVVASGTGASTTATGVTSGAGTSNTSTGSSVTTTGSSAASSGAGGTLTTGSSTAAGGSGPVTMDAGRNASTSGSGGGSGQGGAPRDGGVGGSAGSTGGTRVDASTTSLMDAAVDYNTPLICTSGDHWLNGDKGAAAMHPGRACIDCHSMKNGPAFEVAGTIFPTAHEPDDCNGTDGLFAGATVRITGADGQTFSLQANFAGNFSLGTATAKVARPFRAMVVGANGRQRSMQTPQMVGDCNGCHTVTGMNGAPGRIMAP